jgi:hypothetical protein
MTINLSAPKSGRGGDGSTGPADGAQDRAFWPLQSGPFSGSGAQLMKEVAAEPRFAVGESQIQRTNVALLRPNGSRQFGARGAIVT